MVIDRSKHNKYSVNQVYTPSGTTQTEQQTAQPGSSQTIYISGGSGSGSGLTEEQLKKLESIEEGAQVNQNAFSTVQVSDGSITNEITAQNPSDTIKLTYVNPIEISLVDGNIQISYVGNDSLWSLDESGNLWTDRNVYSTKEISAYGFREGGVSPGGASYLYELGDVDYESAFSPINKGILQYNSTLKKWVVTDGSSISPDASIYATKQYVTEQINLLIGSAPDVLDTIYEIAEALNNDPDYVKDIANNLSNLTNRVVKLEDMFEWDNGVIKAKADLYGVGEISAYGYNSGSTPTGAQYLSELLDVDLTNIADQCILQYNILTKKWEATDGSNIKPDLSAYATQTWVTQRIQNATESLRSEFNSEISEIENSIVTINGNITVIQGNITTINGEILTVKSNITSIKSDISTIKQDIVSINDALDLLNKMFEWDRGNIKAKANLYSVGEISAYGYQDGSASSGVQYLHELLDVTLTGLTSGQLLSWNGSKWININKDEVGLNESELQQYLTENNYAKKSDIPKTINWVNVTNKPSWITNEKPIYSWTDITNKPTIFTTNIGNISDLNSSWDSLLKNKPTAYITRWPSFSEVTNKPTTLSGYGITDGVNSITLTGSGNAVTSASINGHVITLTKGSTFSLSTHNHDSVYVNVTGDTMSGTLTLPTIVVNTRIQLGNAYIEYDSTNNAVVIKNKTTNQIVNFYATGEVSAYGFNDGESSSGVSYLSELKDVNITSISENDMLVWNGSKWYNVPMSDISPELNLDNVLDLNANWATLLKNDPKEYVTRWPKISEVTNKQYLIIKLNSGTTEGTNLFTYNATTAKTINITPSTIGAAASSHNHSWANITSGKPTTLSGYGITDGVNTVSVTGSGNAITAASISGHTLTLTKGSTFLLSSAYTAADILAKLKTVDGSGSGLDADLLDGLQWSNYNLERLYIINASSLDKTKFYPIFFKGGVYNLLLEIYSPGGASSAEYNTNRFRAVIHSNGWDDSGEALVMLSRFNYQDTEITIGAIGFGSENGGIAVWVRGGRNYTLRCNRTPSLKTSDYTYGTEIYTVGTNLYGGTNTKVTIKWQNNSYRAKYDVALVSSNVASATKLQTPRTIWGQSFDGTANIAGALTGATDIIASGNIQATSLYAKNGGYFYNDSGWFQNSISSKGLYNKAEDARWYASGAAWCTDKQIRPTATNSKSLGTSTYRWSNVYSVLGNFSGLITASAGLTTPQYIQIGSGRIYWDSTNNALYVKKSDGTAINFYSLGEISAYGAGSGGSSGGGVSYLHELSDVTISNQKTDDMLKWNGSKWVNIPMSDVKPDLSSYVTIGTTQTITGTKTFNNLYISNDRYISCGTNALLGYNTSNDIIYVGNVSTKMGIRSEGDLKHYTTATAYTILDTGNYTTTLDTRYVKKSGDIMTGSLAIPIGVSGLCFGTNTTYEGGRLLASSDGRMYLQAGTEGKLSITGRNTVNLVDLSIKADSATINGNEIWHAGNDGSGSGLNADLLDGTHKTGLLTALSSSSATNLSITVGGTTKSVADLYATIAEKLSTSSAGSATRPVYFANGIPVAGTYTFGNASGNAAINNGTLCSNLNADLLDGYQSTSFDLSTNLGNCVDHGYYVIGLLQITDYTTAGNHANGRLSFIRTNGNNTPQQIQYALSTKYNSTNVRFSYIALGNNVVSPCTFTYNSKKWAGFVVKQASSYSNGVICTRFGLRSSEKSTPFLLKYYTSNTETINNSEVYDSLVINGIDIIEDNVRAGQFVGALAGNASSATKLATARTIWGKSFDGTANISGNMAYVGKITFNSDDIYLTDPDGYNILTRQNKNLFLQSNAGGYLSLGYRGTSYIDFYGGVTTASTGGTTLGRWNTTGLGVGTASPSYRLHVAGSFAVTANTKTITIYSENTTWCHYRTTATNGHWFGNNVTIQGNLESYGGTKNLGASDARWNLYAGTGNFTGAVSLSSTFSVSGTTSLSTTNISGTLTAANGIITDYDGSTWISMATRSNLIRSATNNSASSAHALFRVKNSGGDAIVFGGLGTNCGFYGFTAEQISAGTNGTNWSTVWDVATGKLTHNKAMSVSGAVTLSSTLSVASTSTFTGAITVNGESTFTKLLHVNGGAHTLNNQYFSTFNTSGTYCSMLGIDGNNYGFVGTTERIVGMVLKSYDRFLFTFNGSANYVTINKSGIVCKGEITAFSSSDIRLKKNLKELKAINTLRKINIFEYDWTEEALQLKANKNVHDYGIIAQELELIIPEAVTHDMYGKGYLGIDYTKLIPFTISAIKEVDDEVTTLKKRVKELEDRLSKYESSVK